MTETRAPKVDENPRVHVSDGLSQVARHLPALEKNYFNVHEMSFEQLLTQLQDYARLIQIPGLDHRNISAAVDLFADDEIVIMAQMLSVNLNHLDHQFELRLQQEVGNHQWLLEAQEMTTPLGLAKWVDSWLVLLRYPQSRAGEELYGMIESVVIGFGKEFYPLIQQTPLSSELPQLFSPHFIELLRQDSVRQASLLQTSVESDAPRTDILSTESELKSVYSSLLKSVEMIQHSARKLLPESMLAQYHDPAISLRIAFVALFKKLQDKLNRFTLNYLDFYFNQVLQARTLPMQSDSVFLVIKPNLHQERIVLEQGTEFFAGLDGNSRDIIYRADNTTEINDAQVVRLHTLNFPNHALPDDPSRKWVDACWLNTLPTYENAKESEQMPFYPLFGEPRGQIKSDDAVDGRLGFAIASNVLLMREGKRKVTVHLQYAHLNVEGCCTLEKKLTQLPALKATKANKRAANKAKFFAYFGNIFNLEITTAEGWYKIPEYKPAYHETDSSLKPNCLSVSFYLPEDCPPITAFANQVHGVGQPTSVPVLRFLLRDNHLQYPYDLLREFVLREIRILVNVEGCRDLILHNNLGQLSPLAPFAPFGPLPSIGSYFIFGHDEIRTKQLTAVDVDIEWKGLPDVANGFTQWYQGYLTPKDTEKFVVSASVLADGKWQPSDFAGSQRQELFAMRNKNGKTLLAAQKRLSCSAVIPYYKAQDGRQARKAFVYTPATKAGLFKFTLQGPLGGFGHQEYQQILTNTLTYNARVKHSQLFKPMPNAPYTPEIASISINYSAVSVMTLADSERLQNSEFKDQFFHLHPLGWEKISPLRHPRIFQLPQYPDAGNLLIGLTTGDMQQLNLLFHFHNDSLPMKVVSDIPVTDNYFHHPDNLHPAISWSYLADNQWRTLAPKQILADSTQGFMRSGIVTLDLPGDLSADNSLLPPGIFWLRVSANHQLKNFSHLYSVYAQAISATWAAGEHPPSNPPMVLPANTITRTRKSLPGIASVTQICASFGGVPAETQAHLRTRMSGRLRHKNRALTPRDYELLILEKFPQVYKVKCFANISTQGDKAVCPGHLLIIPVPHISESQPHFYQPHFDGHLILAIKEFVRQLASPFATISVENPVYEEIQVRCKVQLKKGVHAGRYHNLLNQDLCNFLSPWVPLGNQVHFGWSISAQDIQAFIHNLPYVEFVTDFSLLRIAPRSNGLFYLDDTAIVDAAHSGTLRPTYLWSTAVPIQHHYIESTGNKKPIAAEITGYDELEVGSTFIIS